MNNKGFAITGFIYTIFIIFIILMVAILNMFNSRKNILDKLKQGVLKDVNKVNDVTNLYDDITLSGEVSEFMARSKGYYSFTIKSPKGSANGSTISFEIFLNRGEVIYLKIGNTNYNNNEIDISLDKSFKEENIIAHATYIKGKNYVKKIINNRIIYNIKIQENNNTSSGIITPAFVSKIKKNSDLNRVQYVKDCVLKTSNNGPIWSDIKVFVDGDNKAYHKPVSSNIKGIDTIKLMDLVDNDNDTKLSLDEDACVIVNLERTYNIDAINIVHDKDINVFDHKTYVSSDNINYHIIKNSDEYETDYGIIIDSYNDKEVMKSGNIYVPVKYFDNAKWLRLFHHNNMEGEIYWDALAQILTDGGYESSYKQSVLFDLSKYKNKNGAYEFLLEYSDIPGYNRWIQTSNPIESNEKVTGYKAIHIDHSIDGWYGLALSSSNNVLVDGSNGSNFYYPIGVILSDKKGISINTKNITKYSTDLWIRIDDN